MKKLALIALLLASQAFGAEGIYLPNTKKFATGTTNGSKELLDVNVVQGSLTFTENATAADGDPLSALLKVIGGYDGTNVQAIKTDTGGELQVDVLSSALPTGAATSANQTTANTSLA